MRTRPTSGTRGVEYPIRGISSSRVSRLSCGCAAGVSPSSAELAVNSSGWLLTVDWPGTIVNSRVEVALQDWASMYRCAAVRICAAL